MNKNLITHLQITHYMDGLGASYGAEHYYGEIKGYLDDKIESVFVEGKMTKREAAELSKKDEWEYEKGDTKSRFKTKEEILELAPGIWKKHFPDAIILIRGHFAVVDPREILVAPDEDFKTKCNIIWKKSADIGGWDGTQEDLMREICKEWDALWEELETDG